MLVIFIDVIHFMTLSTTGFSRFLTEFSLSVHYFSLSKYTSRLIVKTGFEARSVVQVNNPVIAFSPVSSCIWTHCSAVRFPVCSTRLTNLKNDSKINFDSWPYFLWSVCKSINDASFAKCNKLSSRKLHHFDQFWKMELSLKSEIYWHLLVRLRLFWFLYSRIRQIRRARDWSIRFFGRFQEF